MNIYYISIIIIMMIIIIIVIIIIIYNNIYMYIIWIKYLSIIYYHYNL
jgi:hypothetical protein